MWCLFAPLFSLGSAQMMNYLFKRINFHTVNEIIDWGVVRIPKRWGWQILVQMLDLPQHSGSLIYQDAPPDGGSLPALPQLAPYTRSNLVSGDAVLTSESLRFDSENRRLVFREFFFERRAKVQLCEFFINSVLPAAIKLDRASLDLLIYSRFHI
jgi:hypothetical protein